MSDLDHRRRATAHYERVVRHELKPGKMPETQEQVLSRLEALRLQGLTQPVVVTHTELWDKFESIKRGDPPQHKL